MIYQERAKQRVAAHYQIQYAKLAHLPYQRWARLRARYIRNTGSGPYIA